MSKCFAMLGSLSTLYNSEQCRDILPYSKWVNLSSRSAYWSMNSMQTILPSSSLNRTPSYQGKISSDVQPNLNEVAWVSVQTPWAHLRYSGYFNKTQILKLTYLLLTWRGGVFCTLHIFSNLYICSYLIHVMIISISLNIISLIKIHFNFNIFHKSIEHMCIKYTLTFIY